MSDYKKSGESNLGFITRTSRYKAGAVFNSKTAGREYRVLKLQAGRGGVYGLLEMTDKVRRHTSVLALIIMVESRRGIADYKALTELDGPNMANMPEKLLRELMPLDALYFSPEEVRRATEWRAKCQKALDNRAALQPGVRFVTHEPVSFGDAGNHSEFQVRDLKKRLFIGNPGMPNQFNAKLSQGLLDGMQFTVRP